TISYLSSFSNHHALTQIYTLSLHDALPIFPGHYKAEQYFYLLIRTLSLRFLRLAALYLLCGFYLVSNRSTQSYRQASYVLLALRSEEHTSELQSRENLVCRLLLEKKNNMK